MQTSFFKQIIYFKGNMYGAIEWEQFALLFKIILISKQFI